MNTIAKECLLAWQDAPNDPEALANLIRAEFPRYLREITDGEVEQWEDGDNMAWNANGEASWRVKWSNGQEIDFTIVIRTEAEEAWKCIECGVETLPSDVLEQEFLEDMIDRELCPDCYREKTDAEMAEAENAHA